MLRPRPGRIVDISAMAGRVCLPYAEVYAAAKGGGVIGFTRVLRSYQHMRGCFVQLCSLAARSCTPGTGFQAAPRARPSGGDARQHRYSHRSFC
jgi:NAD(P)-dependent dehydrogenase (short-subunit alcohol dehydrogenase family)